MARHAYISIKLKWSKIVYSECHTVEASYHAAAQRVLFFNICPFSKWVPQVYTWHERLKAETSLDKWYFEVIRPEYHEQRSISGLEQHLFEKKNTHLAWEQTDIFANCKNPKVNWDCVSAGRSSPQWQSVPRFMYTSLSALITNHCVHWLDKSIPSLM